MHRLTSNMKYAKENEIIMDRIYSLINRISIIYNEQDIIEIYDIKSFTH